MKNKLLYSLLYIPALVLSGVMIYYTTESNFSKVEINSITRFLFPNSSNYLNIKVLIKILLAER